MPSPSRVYGRRWRRLRAAYLAQHPLCECGCGYPATIVDHRIPHNGDQALMYAWSNLAAMTKQCHDAKTAARDGGFGNPVKSAMTGWRGIRRDMGVKNLKLDRP